MNTLIDTHAHLEEIEDLAAALKRASQKGVAAVVAVGADLQSNQQVLKIAQSYRQPRIYPALGMHPGNLVPGEISSCLKLIEEHIDEAVALGEIGLDFWYKEARKDPAVRERQKQVFLQQLALARRYQKAVIIHSRGAWRECLDNLRDAGIEQAVFHWYSGPQDVLEEILKAGYFISATPAAEYSPEHRQAIADTPLEKLLIETDSPVVFKPASGKYTSEPKDVFRSLQAVAQIKQLKAEEIAAQSYRSARVLFALD